MNTLRAGILGCGMIAEHHLRGWQRIPEVEVVALADSEPRRAEQRRDEFAPGARVHESLDEMLKQERLDFVDIITPPWLHLEHCLRAAAADIHVLCQKPLCDRLEAACELVAALKDHSKLFVVHENHPWRPWFREIVRRQREGCFGRPRFLHLEQHDSREPAQKFKADAERGVLLEYGVHLVEMVRALLGEPRRVSARLDRINPRVRGESLAHVMFEFVDATAVIDISWKAHGLPQGGALFIGDSGEAVYEGRMTNGGEARFRIARGSEVVVDELRNSTADYTEAFYLLEREFTDCMLTGRGPEQTAANSLKTLEATFAAYRAAESNAPVTLTP